MLNNYWDVLKMGAIIFARWRGRWDEAVEMEQQVLDEYVASIGLYNTPTALRVSGLASSLYRAGRLEDAEERYRVLDTIIEQVPVPGWLLARDQGRFSVVLRVNKKGEEADERLGRALEIVSRLSPDDPGAGFALNSLAWSLWEQGMYDEAEPLAQRAVAWHDRTTEPRHNERLYALDTLACFRRDLDRLDESLALFGRIESICRGAVPPRAVSARFTLHHAETLIMAGRHADAEALLLAVENRTADVRRALAALYDDWGKPEKANEWREVADEAEKGE
jgi:tetratricopeptide (TPR) repeat protein